VHEKQKAVANWDNFNAAVDARLHAILEKDEWLCEVLGAAIGGGAQDRCDALEKRLRAEITTLRAEIAKTTEKLHNELHSKLDRASDARLELYREFHREVEALGERVTRTWVALQDSSTTAFAAMRDELREAATKLQERLARLPAVREWSDGVSYVGDVVVHNGAAFQALKDTGKPPAPDHPRLDHARTRRRRWP